MPSFSKYHNDGTPVITSYEDVFCYLEGDKRQPSLISAMALHVFHLHLRDAIRRREADTGKRMTRDETDAYIRQIIGANDLNNFRRYAEEMVVNQINRERRNAVLKNVLPFAGAWAGFWGNMLTLLIGFFLAVTFALYRSDNTVVSFLGFIDRCVKFN